MFDLFYQHRIIDVSVEPEEVTADDIINRDTFVTSGLCGSIEKTLKNRIAEKNGEVLTHTRNSDFAKASVAQGKMEELRDILLEWKNLRDDLQNRNAKQ